MLAAVVRLLDTEHIRIGNEQYAQRQQELRRDHAAQPPPQRKGSKMMMRFTGKHGIVHEVQITDTNLKRICKRCQDLPGQMLFQYVNGDGEPKPVTSGDVNDYIKEATGGDFTAKHFRTWSASVIALEQLLKKAENARITVKTVVEPVAEALGNTPAISRKSYVHPGAARGGEGRRARPARRHGAAARPQAPVERRSRAARIPRARRASGGARRKAACQGKPAAA